MSRKRKHVTVPVCCGLCKIDPKNMSVRAGGRSQAPKRHCSTCDATALCRQPWCHCCGKELINHTRRLY